MIFADDARSESLKVERGAVRTFSTPFLRIQLWKSRRVWYVQVQHATLGCLGLGAFRYFASARDYYNFLVDDWNVGGFKVTDADMRFLKACGITIVEEQ